MKLKQFIVAPALPYNPEIQSLVLDSRQVKPGDCFVAIMGTGSDGRDYMAQAIEAGAVAIVYEAQGLTKAQDTWLSSQSNYPLIPYSGLKDALPSMAARFYGEPSEHMHVIAVTGTNGKSSIVHGISQLYGAFQEPCMMVGTLGIGPLSDIAPNPLTTPDCISLQRHLAFWRAKGIETVAMEASSHALDQGRLAAINIRTAIFTNLTRDHLDYHETMEAYGAAKALLYKIPSVEHVVFNLDDAWCVSQLPHVEESKVCVGYSLKGNTHPRCARVLQGQRHDHALELQWGDSKAACDVPLLGDFNFSNILAMMSALLLEGFPLDDIAARIDALHCIPGRMQKAIPHGEPMVVIDYAHTPDALEKALQTMREYTRGRLICVFGCGGDRDAGKRELMGAVASRLADFCIITNDNPRSEPPLGIAVAIASGMKHQEYYRIELDRVAAIKTAISMAQDGDAILIAGKGHEKIQTIGKEHHHHDDVQVASAILRERQHEAE